MRASGVSNPLDRIRHRLDSWLFEDMSTGRFMLDRAIFTDPELFDLEMKHILRAQLGVSRPAKAILFY